jgi:hypothetical protein
MFSTSFFYLGKWSLSADAPCFRQTDVRRRPALHSGREAWAHCQLAAPLVIG